MYGPPEFSETSQFCGIMDSFFENPTVFDFGSNDIAICNGICTKSIMRNVARNQIGVGDINSIVQRRFLVKKESTLYMSPKNNNSVSQDGGKGGKKSKSLFSSI